MNELRRKRKELGLTQIQAANACGVSRRTYQTYEETEIKNDTFQDILDKLNEMGILDGSNYILNIRYIKYCCKQVFSNYPEITSAYLFGSYARGEATGKSDVDILIVCPPLGLRLFGIAPDLENLLHKKVDLHRHVQAMDNETLFVDILNEGIKVYG